VMERRMKEFWGGGVGVGGGGRPVCGSALDVPVCSGTRGHSLATAACDGFLALGRHVCVCVCVRACVCVCKLSTNKTKCS